MGKQTNKPPNNNKRQKNPNQNQPSFCESATRSVLITILAKENTTLKWDCTKGHD